jgi:hypothetical protein
MAGDATYVLFHFMADVMYKIVIVAPDLVVWCWEYPRTIGTVVALFCVISFVLWLRICWWLYKHFTALGRLMAAM